MKRNGFTLVELLAVIAILAILVIIALPNVMGMFNEAKKNSFTTEIKEIYKVAEQEWIMDSMIETKDRVYSRCETCTSKSLNLTGRSQLDYLIKIDKSGKVAEFYATDGSYQYVYNGGDLRVENIYGIVAVSDLDDADILTISDSIVSSSMTTFYYFETSSLTVGITTPTWFVKYNSYEELNNAKNTRIFLRVREDNNIIKDVELGFKANGNLYYLNDSNSYESNKQLLSDWFGSGCEDNGNNYTCGFDNMFLSLEPNNVIQIYDYTSIYACDVSESLQAECFLSEPV